MTHKLMKAFTAWWSASSIACDRGTDCRDAYEAGWEASVNCPVKTSDLPMNEEIEFQKWWARTQFRNVMGEEAAKQIWNAAYAAGRAVESANANNAQARGKADARAAIETRLLGMAGHAFVAGQDAKAHWFRSLVNVLFKGGEA